VLETVVEEVSPGDLPRSTRLRFDHELTVEAWVSGRDDRAEILQALVSKWSPLTTFDAFDAYDAGNTDGLETKAYFGAVFDGRYVYFSPQHNATDSHARVLRYDTQGDFHDPASYAAYDAAGTARLDTRGYYGAVFDGRYVYFVPRQVHSTDPTGSARRGLLGEYHSRILRYDTHLDFKNPEAWDAQDAGEAHSQQGVAFDGTYIYFSPGFAGNPANEDTHSSRVIRYNTKADFHAPESWTVFDASGVAGLDTGCFDGGAFDGRHVYFVPLMTGAILRYDTKSDFCDRQSWQAYDGKRKELGMCVGAVYDGRHMYFVPYRNARVVRYRIGGPFDADDGWEMYDANGTGGLDTNGFDGGFFDGRYVYFIPFVSGNRPQGENPIHCNWLRYDTQSAFGDPSSWDSHDAAHTSGLFSNGYNGGAFDGRYCYLAPWRDGTGVPSGTCVVHGYVLRYDTLGSSGSFSLRYCDYGHNGGLCAAVPGPSFTVNTDRGAVSVAAHRALDPGQHHLAGVYDGKKLKLLIDGRLAAERAGTGRIQNNDLPITIGKIYNGLGDFRGTVRKVRISDIARSDAWIRAALACIAALVMTVSPISRAAESKTAKVTDQAKKESALVTKATLGPFRLRLLRGSMRVNRDEMPLISGERYSLKIGGKDYSHYAWRVETECNSNSVQVTSSDKAGPLRRKLTFTDDGFEFDFRLKLKPGLQDNRSFYYDLQLDPEFFYGAEDRTGLVMRVSLPNNVRKEHVLPPFQPLKEKPHGSWGQSNCPEFALAWEAYEKQHEMTVQFASDDPAVRCQFYDKRGGGGYYLLRIRAGDSREHPDTIAFRLVFAIHSTQGTPEQQ